MDYIEKTLAGDDINLSALEGTVRFMRLKYPDKDFRLYGKSVKGKIIWSVKFRG